MKLRLKSLSEGPVVLAHNSRFSSELEFEMMFSSSGGARAQLSGLQSGVPGQSFLRHAKNVSCSISSSE